MAMEAEERHAKQMHAALEKIAQQQVICFVFFFGEVVRMLRGDVGARVVI